CPVPGSASRASVRVSEMSTPTMRAPRSARWVAMALPIPAAAPVTIAICPSNRVLTVDLLLCRDGGLGRVRRRRAHERARRGAPGLPVPAAAPVTIAICPSTCVLPVALLLCRDGGLGRVRLRPAYDRPCRGAPAHRRRTTLTPPSSHRPHPPLPDPSMRSPSLARDAARSTRKSDDGARGPPPRLLRCLTPPAPPPVLPPAPPLPALRLT